MHTFVPHKNKIFGTARPWGMFTQIALTPCIKRQRVNKKAKHIYYVTPSLGGVRAKERSQTRELGEGQGSGTMGLMTFVLTKVFLVYTTLFLSWFEYQALPLFYLFFITQWHKTSIPGTYSGLNVKDPRVHVNYMVRLNLSPPSFRMYFRVDQWIKTRNNPRLPVAKKKVWNLRAKLVFFF